MLFTMKDLLYVVLEYLSAIGHKFSKTPSTKWFFKKLFSFASGQCFQCIYDLLNFDTTMLVLLFLFYYFFISYMLLPESEKLVSSESCGVFLKLKKAIIK